MVGGSNPSGRANLLRYNQSVGATFVNVLAPKPGGCGSFAGLCAAHTLRRLNQVRQFRLRVELPRFRGPSQGRPLQGHTAGRGQSGSELAVGAGAGGRDCASGSISHDWQRAASTLEAQRQGSLAAEVQRFLRSLVNANSRRPLTMHNDWHIQIDRVPRQLELSR